MFQNPLTHGAGKEAVKQLSMNNREQKLKAKNKQRELAKKTVSVKKPERGHEERLHKRMSEEGDRTASDYR